MRKRNTLEQPITKFTLATLVGAGTGDFYSSGTDFTDFAHAESLLSDPSGVEEAVEEASRVLGAFVAAFIDFPKPLVALVNGPAVGIAATTLALCDLVYAVDAGAFVETPFTRLALTPEGCSTYTFPRYGTGCLHPLPPSPTGLSNLEA